MIVVERVLEPGSPAALAGKARDTLPLTWEERRWTRKRVLTREGREVALALPTGSRLAPGDLLHVAPTWYLEVEPVPEPVLLVSPRDPLEALRVAFEVGNRHFPLAVEAIDLLVPDDPAMLQLLSRLGVPWERRTAVFEPFGSVHGHAR
jgi:urease accessory protein